MNKAIGKLMIKVCATGILLLVILVGLVFNPTLLYANKKVIGNYTLYYNTQINDNLLSRLDNASKLLESSEIYDSAFKLDICLNDGSLYPALLGILKGPAWGHGFYNKVVLTSNVNVSENTATVNGWNWNLTQLICHEAVHCYQYNKYGLETLNIPVWKLEGYAEYVSRKGDEHLLNDNISRLFEAKDNLSVELSDKSIVPIDYYKNWLLVKYCFDIKHMNYQVLWDDVTPKETLENEMMNWYKRR